MISLTSKLAALQQAEYEVPRYRNWLHSHRADTLTIEPKRWTAKLKFIRGFTVFFTPLLGEDRALLVALNTLKVPEGFLRRCILFAARIKLRMLQKKGLIVVSISGSYAKTSTKLILKHQLEQAIPLLATPESINTPLGIAREILRNLHPRHKLFLAELGAYYPGDIAQLARFVRPQYSILTPIGPEHLERFGSMQQVADSELEITHLKPLPQICTYEANTQWMSPDIPATRYGRAEGELQVKSSHTNRSGTEAEIIVNSTSLNIFFPLYGAHNTENLLPGFWLADRLGIATEIVRKRCATIPPVPHRLEPTLTQNQVLILDNGYNTSPHTAPRVLQTVKEIPGSNKIIITAGYVELGEEQYRYNIELGKEIAKTATAVGIVGTANRKALADGLIAAGFSEKNIVFADTEAEATQQLQPRIIPQSVVLYEGGTPEIYQ